MADHKRDLSEDFGWTVYPPGTDLDEIRRNKAEVDEYIAAVARGENPEPPPSWADRSKPK